MTMLDLGQPRGTGTLAAAAALIPAGAVQFQAAPPSTMGDMPGMSGNAGTDGPRGRTVGAAGRVAAVNAGHHGVTLDHQPISAVGWTAMGPEMQAAQSVNLTKVRSSEKAKFTPSGAKNLPTLRSITPVL